VKVDRDTLVAINKAASEVSADLAAHNHDADYADIAHNHDADYADIAHAHDATYLNVSGDAMSGYLNLNSNILYGLNVGDTFTYDGDTIPHYGMVWFLNSAEPAGASAAIAGYGGVNIFTAGLLRFRIGSNGATGFFGSTGTTKPTITGSKGGNAALASLLTALANLGLVTDSTT
jgi:hypothetical protein